MTTEVEELKNKIELYKEYVDASEELIQVLLDFYNTHSSPYCWQYSISKEENRVFVLKSKLYKTKVC